MTSETQIKVRGYHLDVYGHVNNARYLEFLEEGRWQAFEEQGSFEALTKAGLGFSVVNININYMRPALLGDVLAIETSLKSISNKSAIMHQVVHLRDTTKIVAQADVTFVMVSAQTGRAVDLDKALMEKLGLAGMHESGAE